MSSWKTMALSECLEPIKSNTKAQRGWSPQCLNHPVASDDKWGVLKTTAVQMGLFDPKHNKELPAKLEPKIHLEVQRGDFLMTTTGPRNRCGVICYVKDTPTKLIFSGKILRFRVNKEVVDPRWVEHVLLSPNYQKELDSMKVGTSDSSVSIGNSQVLALQIPVPPLDKQCRILETLENQLSKLDKAFTDLGQADSQSIVLRRSILNTLLSAGESGSEESAWRGTTFNWEYKSLEDACSLITDGSHFSPKTGSIGDFPYITVRDLRDGAIDFLSCQFIDETAFKELQKNGCQPCVGDVLFSKDGTVGKVAIVVEPQPFVVLSSLAILRPKTDILAPGFLSYVLQSPRVLETALGMKTGTAIRRVVLRNLKKLVIPIPPLDEQYRIVEMLNESLSKVESSRKVITSQMESLKNVRQSLLNRAFSEELESA